MKAKGKDETTDEQNAPQVERLEDNVLVISETRKAVVLPYSEKELQKTLRDRPEYADLRELIEKEYTVPLSRYKFGCIARYKEAFVLVRKREKGSVLSAFGLALEMFFTRLLHPAIITACKNRDWLDVYLDCLNKNELDDFPFFEIRYESKCSKTKRKSTADNYR